MVCAADQLASMAGVAMLAEGGSAADAAVSAAAVMAVTSPHLCGMGGDLLAMVSPPGAPPVALLGIGRAGSGVDAARMRSEGKAVIPLRGDVRSVTVPGAVDAWLALHDRFGRLPLATVLGPAIEVAEEGFVASLLLALASHLVFEVPGAHELCPQGALQPGARVRLPGLARTLKSIAQEGRDGLYRGEFGEALVGLSRGVIAAEDLDRSAADWCDPLRLSVWDHDLWTVPPPSQGYLTLASSWIAEHLGIGADPSDPRWAHIVVEASRAAGFDRPGVLHDHTDGRTLIAEQRLSEAAGRIHPDRAAPPEGTGSPDVANATLPRSGDGDTTHLCAIDADGLGVSLTQSNALDFGSHLVAGTTGIFLHNRGVGFSLVPGHPAELGPGRRPPHTLSPMLATAPDGSLSHLVGAMGGDAQPQILLQLLARMLRGGQDPATAVSGARLALDAASAGPFRLWWGDDLTIRVESHAPPGWKDGLVRRGHRVRSISAFDPVVVGCAQIITVATGTDATSRHYVGAADPRSPEGGTAGR
jgi:gamma-glutamyltranspeptidase/glutathione hydrolase